MGPNWGGGERVLGAETLSCSGTSVSEAVSLKVQLRPQEAAEASHTFCSRGGQPGRAGRSPSGPPPAAGRGRAEASSLEALVVEVGGKPLQALWLLYWRFLLI